MKKPEKKTVKRVFFLGTHNIQKYFITDTSLPKNIIIMKGGSQLVLYFLNKINCPPREGKKNKWVMKFEQISTCSLSFFRSHISFVILSLSCLSHVTLLIFPKRFHFSLCLKFNCFNSVNFVLIK